MNTERLQTHVALCRRNLKSERVKCCANCPLEEEIVGAYPELKAWFQAKRQILSMSAGLKAFKGAAKKAGIQA